MPRRTNRVWRIFHDTKLAIEDMLQQEDIVRVSIDIDALIMKHKIVESTAYAVANMLRKYFEAKGYYAYLKKRRLHIEKPEE